MSQFDTMMLANKEQASKYDNQSDSDTSSTSSSGSETSSSGSSSGSDSAHPKYKSTSKHAQKMSTSSSGSDSAHPKYKSMTKHAQKMSTSSSGSESMFVESSPLPAQPKQSKKVTKVNKAPKRTPQLAIPTVLCNKVGNDFELISKMPSQHEDPDMFRRYSAFRKMVWCCVDTAESAEHKMSMIVNIAQVLGVYGELREVLDTLDSTDHLNYEVLANITFWFWVCQLKKEKVLHKNVMRVIHEEVPTSQIDFIHTMKLSPFKFCMGWDKVFASSMTEMELGEDMHRWWLIFCDLIWPMIDSDPVQLKYVLEHVLELKFALQYVDRHEKYNWENWKRFIFMEVLCPMKDHDKLDEQKLISMLYRVYDDEMPHIATPVISKVPVDKVSDPTICHHMDVGETSCFFEADKKSKTPRCINKIMTGEDDAKLGLHVAQDGTVHIVKLCGTQMHHLVTLLETAKAKHSHLVVLYSDQQKARENEKLWKEAGFKPSGALKFTYDGTPETE
jgi:hypothetical protein